MFLTKPRLFSLPAITTLMIFLLALTMAYRMDGSVAAASPPSAATFVPPGYSSTIIQVKFQEGTKVHPPGAPLPPSLKNSVANISRLFSLPEQKLDELRVRGANRSPQRLPNLNMWFQITLKSGTDADDFIENLKRLDSVEIVEPAPLPAPPSAITPDFTGNQGYLDPATDGINAYYAWTITGGNGSGVTIYDVEYSWNQTHEDLSKANGVPLLLNPGETSIDPFNNNNHGTAVLGELVADNNSKGVTGISWGADVGLAPANTNSGYNPANAILLAVADGSAGDVILIEQQFPVCGLRDYGPSEWVSSVFDAIQTATANGIAVVEAAGNGGVDLDQLGCENRFNRATRDSGAIIVGAGGPPTGGIDRERLSFSSYGSRLDVQGWGGGVMTTGYGAFYTNPDDPTNPDFWYVSSFNGTSSASPIVAGAVANLQGIAKQIGSLLTPAEVRTLLVQTGSPQLGNIAEHIGPRPDLREAIAQNFPPDLTLIKTVTPNGPVIPGQAITYTLTFSNIGADIAANVVITDILPVTLTNVTVVSSGVTITNTGVSPSYVWDVQDLANGEGGVITITGQISAALTADTTVFNTATITDPKDKKASNNSSEVAVNVVVPDLTAGKTNNTGGSGRVGTPYNWAVTIANTGSGPAIFNTGQMILTDNLPLSGATYGPPTVQNISNVTNAGNIVCTITANDLTCTATGATVALGATGGQFEVTFPVTPTAIGSLLNPRGGGLCRVDPQAVVTESNESNNDCSDSLNIIMVTYLPVVLKN